jgi:hypothetical protein
MQASSVVNSAGREDCPRRSRLMIRVATMQVYTPYKHSVLAAIWHNSAGSNTRALMLRGFLRVRQQGDHASLPLIRYSSLSICTRRHAARRGSDGTWRLICRPQLLNQIRSGTLLYSYRSEGVCGPIRNVSRAATLRSG